MPLGGKVESFFSPPCTRRTNFTGLRPDHFPFHFFSATRTSISVRSGTQNPILNSFSSVSVRCPSTSSRLVGGRPLRRSCLSCASSSASRYMYLEAVSTVLADRCTGNVPGTLLGDHLGQFSLGEGLGDGLNCFVKMVNTVRCSALVCDRSLKPLM